MPLRHRSDFKQALSTLQRLQLEAGEEPQVPTYSNKHKQWIVHLLNGGIGKAHGGLLIIQKVKKDVSQVWSGRGDPFLAVLARIFENTFTNSIILLQLDRLQLTAVYCNRRGV